MRMDLKYVAEEKLLGWQEPKNMVYQTEDVLPNDSIRLIAVVFASCRVRRT